MEETGIPGKKTTVNVLGTTNHTNSGVISGVLGKQLH
jgi:hypothetical protein